MNVAFWSFLLHDYVSWIRNKDLSLSKQTLQIMDKLWHYFHNHLDNFSMILKYKFLRVRMNLPFVKSFCFNYLSNIYLTYLFYEVISTLHVLCYISEDGPPFQCQDLFFHTVLYRKPQIHNFFFLFSNDGLHEEESYHS